MTIPLLAPNTALFLDIDGTLIEFVPRPADARVAPALLETLAALQRRLDGALALASGRVLADADRLFAPLKLAAAGQHGAEIRMTPNGSTQVFVSLRPAFHAVLAAAAPYIAAHPPLRAEDKGLSLGFHFRGGEAVAAGLRDVLAAAVAQQGGALQLLDGHLNFDVRSGTEHKGRMVERFMAVAPFKGRVPIYCGDAGTDEDGFIAALAAGGRAIRVGSPQPTCAMESLADPASLRAWLAESAAALGG